MVSNSSKREVSVHLLLEYCSCASHPYKATVSLFFKHGKVLKSHSSVFSSWHPAKAEGEQEAHKIFQYLDCFNFKKHFLFM